MFWCYPLRSYSLVAYSIVYDCWLALVGDKFGRPCQEAPVIMAEHLRTGFHPIRAEGGDVAVPDHVRRTARFILPAIAWPGPFHRFFFDFMDGNAPDLPLLKSFLRVDLRPGKVEFRCFGSTGCGEHEANPFPKARVEGNRTASGDCSLGILPPTDLNPSREEQV